jgi:hypothetical protein
MIVPCVNFSEPVTASQQPAERSTARASKSTILGHVEALSALINFE